MYTLTERKLNEQFIYPPVNQTTLKFSRFIFYIFVFKTQYLR